MLRYLLGSLLLLAYRLPLSAQPGDVVDSIEKTMVRKYSDAKISWFHPRGCLLPDGTAFLTLQSIGGSDYFGPVHWSISKDQGKTWSDPRPVPGLGRAPAVDGVEEGVCDVVPEYHSKTNTILAMGHNVFYKGGRFYKEQPARWPVYVVRAADGSWSERIKLIWDDPRGSTIYTCNCAQRLMLDDGFVLVPISFGAGKEPRAVTTLLCSFDGKALTVQKTGRELRGKTGRGFLEPSLAVHQGVYYMTIRAEDGRGYVSTSKDGLTWTDPVAWQFDDGTPVSMSTTQQRWLSHSDTLYLVYTRKTPENEKVFRWRAPLFLASVDPKTQRLVRSTEKVVLPMLGNAQKDPKKVPLMGNFHTMPISPQESLVTVGENRSGEAFQGDWLQARIRWKSPNRNVKE